MIRNVHLPLAALLTVLLIAPCAGQASKKAPTTTTPVGKTRTYYIAADEVTWDYAPDGINRISGKPFGEAERYWVSSGPHRMGKTLKKALYHEYTDVTFTHLKPRPKEFEHLGFLGPLIRAEVGDSIQVVYKNIPAPAHPPRC